MRRKLKGITALGGAALILGSFSQAYAAESPVQLDVYFTPMHFEFDGKEMTPPEGQHSFLYQDTTYVPIRFVSYALNKNVSWNADTYTVTVSEPDNARDRTTIEEYNLNRVVHSPERKMLDASKILPTSIEAYMSQVQYVFDGAMKQPAEDKPGLIFNDTLYVPIRFLSESVGREIGFDPKTYTVTATSKQAEPAAPANPVAPAAPKPSGGAIPIPGGGAVTKPSYDSIIQSAESQIAALESSARSSFEGLLAQFKAAASIEEKAALVSQGYAMKSSFGAQFEAILSELSSKLTANGYSTGVVSSYRSQYIERVNAEEAALAKSL
jgi:hypothetical protein